MIARIQEAKTLVKRISCDYKCKFNSNLNQKWNNKTCQCDCKKYRTCTKDYNQNPSTSICESGKYLKVLLILQEVCGMKL